MKHEDIYSSIQAYLDEKNKSNFTNKNDEDIKTHIQDLVGKRVSLSNISIANTKWIYNDDPTK